MNKAVSDYWFDHYCNRDAGCGHTCSLCGGAGLVDTTETAITRDGKKVGRRQPCICPNGQAFRKHLSETNRNAP